MKKKLRDYLNESILDPINKELSPEVWENGKIKKSVKTFITKKIETWLSTYTNKKIKNLFLLGSMTGFQYNKEADLDVNFVVDLTDNRIKEMRKFLPNGQNLPGTKHPINYYMVNKPSVEWKKGPLYNMINDKWIRKPKKDDSKSVIANYKLTIEIVRFFTAGINTAISEYEQDVYSYETYNEYLKNAEEKDKKEIQKMINLKLEEIIADFDGIYIAKHMLKSLRKEGFDENKDPLNIITKIEFKSPDTSIQNLIYKQIERLGYFEKIENILNDKDKWKKAII